MYKLLYCIIIALIAVKSTIIDKGKLLQGKEEVGSEGTFELLNCICSDQLGSMSS